MFNLKPGMLFTGRISFSENVSNHKNMELWVSHLRGLAACEMLKWGDA